jgi:hypothetical protein
MSATNEAILFEPGKALHAILFEAGPFDLVSIARSRLFERVFQRGPDRLLLTTPKGANGARKGS